MAEYTKTIYISDDEAKQIDFYLHGDIVREEDGLGEEETIINTADFGDGIEMDVKCCGVKFHEDTEYYGSNNAWCEAVLFNHGGEVACTEIEDEYLGVWELDYNGDLYIVEVEVG